MATTTSSNLARCIFTSVVAILLYHRTLLETDGTHVDGSIVGSIAIVARTRTIRMAGSVRRISDRTQQGCAFLESYDLVTTTSVRDAGNYVGTVVSLETAVAR